MSSWLLVFIEIRCQRTRYLCTRRWWRKNRKIATGPESSELGIFRPQFLQNEVRVKFSNFHFCSIVANFIPMNMHVCASAHKGNIFICQMQLAGEILLANFCWRSFAGEVSGEVSEQVCSLGMRRNLPRRIGKIHFCFFFKTIHRKFTTNFTMHQGPKPKKSTSWQNILHQICSLKPLSHTLGYQFGGPVFWCNAFHSGSRPWMQV